MTQIPRILRRPVWALGASIAIAGALLATCIPLSRSVDRPMAVEADQRVAQIVPAKPAPHAGAADSPALPDEPEFHTFSICAIDSDAGQCGVAVTTRVTLVGRFVPWVRAGVGAVATQATTAVKYGKQGLDLLEQGTSPAETIEKLLADDASRELRQLGIIDMQGRTAAFTGQQNGAFAGARQGKNYTVQGNLLVGRQVIDAVADRFEATEGTGMPLADRLIAALEAGQAAGGDKRKGQTQSAALLVADANSQGVAGDHIVETLHVAEHPEPVGELRRQYDTIHQRLGYRTFSIIRGRDVIELKRMLHALKLLWPDRPELPSAREQPDLPVYTEETAAAVDRFRHEHGLSVPADRLGHPPGMVDAQLVEQLKGAYNLARRKPEGAPPSAAAAERN